MDWVGRSAKCNFPRDVPRAMCLHVYEKATQAKTPSKNRRDQSMLQSNAGYDNS